MEVSTETLVNLARQGFHSLGVEAAWLGALSLGMFVGSLLLMPLVIRALPADYYCVNRPERARRHPIIEIAILGLKNAIGTILLLAGVAMLVLPGQGLVTIVIGVALVDFPGKKRLERGILKNDRLLSSLNWMRRKMGQPEFKVDC